MEECFRDVNGYLAGSVLLPNLVNNTKYPNMSKARTSKACIEVVQNAGEVIFVPSGWHHEVYNLVSYFYSNSSLVFNERMAIPENQTSKPNRDFYSA